MRTERFEAMLASLKKAIGALRRAAIPFAVGGGFCSWARGGPPVDHDVDLIVKREDLARVLEVLEAAGMKPEQPPEDWLFKVWDGDVVIDLVFQPAGLEVDDELLGRTDEILMGSVVMPVLAAQDLLVTKLVALTEHDLNYEGILETSRSLREQVDWAEVRRRTASSPFARAFFTMAEGLGIVPTRES